ncbi:putative bifunctional diguanylate cyclase/phosphodiesterase [Mangrovihabitans endophyticus]|uniref:PAS domain S-box-containing protein/diguanylate cyclase (GGDEF) domain-containing protein n=1 Tax=Mangrovihabitans endophyticus TaxID=1751298 RepID=A0A8J3C217_9ACTN|nr:EAL domain-containing protein [Mangrovihabitans endophyticus]GGK98782.1 hypothetical protein GCM10012284_36330 [Mangrovihabitans endophyticus]
MAPPFHEHIRTRTAVRAAHFVVPAAAVLVLLAGLGGLIAPRVAVAVGVGMSALWAAAMLGLPAVTHHDGRGPVPAGVHDRRAVGLLTAAALSAGVWAVLPLVAPSTSLPVTAVLALAGVLGVAGAMVLPGGAATWPVRFRRVFDGVGLGISLGFAAWLVRPVSAAEMVALPPTLVGATAVSIMIVVLLGVRPHDGPAARCGWGVVVTLAALTVATNLVVLGHAGAALVTLGVPAVVGLAVTAAGGAHRTVGQARPSAEPPGETPGAIPSAPWRDVRATEPNPAGYPLLTIPAGLGLLAAVYHWIVVGSFDTTAVALGFAMVGTLVMRELLAVSDIRRYAGRLRTNEAHFRSLVAGATDLTLVLDERLTIDWQSPASARLFGLADAQVLGRNFRDLLHPDDAANAQAVIEAVLSGDHADGPPALINARIRDGNGVWRDTESTVSDQRGVPEVAALVVHVRDVGERRQLERALHMLHCTDQLTGLANHRALMRDLLAYRRRAGQQGSLLVIGLHGLADINKAHGRDVGDTVLIEVGSRIRSLLGAEDVPARLGGDEFAVLTADGAVLAYALATRLVTLLMEPYHLPGVIVELHTSVGLAELSGGSDSDEVMRHADLARSRARQLGRDRVEWYDTDVEIKLHRRMDLEHQLLNAADNRELDLVFQPVVNLRDKTPVGIEALVRWRHPTLGTILPGEMLPIARAVGIAGELDEWVLDAACRRLADWSTGDDGFWLSVNVAPRELLATGFPDRVAAVLARHGLAPERLVVEVAEPWVAEDVPAVVAALAALRKLGIRAALDDFGAGQASLSHLRRLPVDMLKLDRTLMNAPTEPIVGPAVVEVVVSLGRRLGLEIVAKGLETEEEIDRARAAGCLYGQGFALARPAPAERIEAYLDTHRSERSH